jgi:UDP-glucose 4-epimerase
LLNYIMARVLITGGAGYVGSHCAKTLAATGHEGIVFDSLLFGHREFVRWGELIEGDIRDAKRRDYLGISIGQMRSRRFGLE